MRPERAERHAGLRSPTRTRPGAGADNLRTYEYGLLVNRQRTSDRVTRVAKLEAVSILTAADEQVAELE